MTETLCYQSDNHQSTFTSNPFMQNHNQYRFGSNNHYDPEINKNETRRKRKRKRTLEETDIETPHYDLSLNHPITNNDEVLNFMKPSNKRRRTNEMSSSNKQSVILEPDLEKNIYANNIFDDNKMDDDDDDNDINIDDNDDNNNDNDDDRSRIDAPYEHLVHPYLKKQAMKNNKDRDSSPEILFSKLNLNGFKMINKENESVNEWRNSIESQLNLVRNQKQQEQIKIDEFCLRIKESKGLGREIVLSQLRKTVNSDLFKKICNKMNIDPYSR